MATLAEIRVRVLTLIIDDNAEVTSEIDGFVRKAQAEAEDRRGLNVFHAFTSYQFGILTFLHTKPADWNGIRLPVYHAEEDGTATFLDTITQETIIDTSSTASGKPTGWLDYSDTEILTWPPADALGWFGGLYDIRVLYWKRLDTLTADGDSNWLTTEAEDYMVWRAGSLAFEFNRDFEQSELYRQKAAAEYARIRRNVVRGSFPRGWTLVPQAGARLGSR